MISACIVSFNEVDNIPRLMKSLKGIDDIVLCDGGSTDGTQELARSLGARVYDRHDNSATVVDADVEEFYARFGYFPSFKQGDKIFNGAANRNEAVSYAKHDWIFNPDCDEVVSWNLPEVKKLLPTCDMVNCKIISDKDGKSYDTRKLYDKRRAKYVGRIHELPMVDGTPRLINIPSMSIRHYQKPRDHRKEYLSVMEYAILKDSDQRSTFYLAKQYAYENIHDKAIQFFTLYLQTATWVPEITEALIFMTKCLWALGKNKEAVNAGLHALWVNPDSREVINLLAKIATKETSPIWKRYAPHARNTNMLIVRE